MSFEYVIESTCLTRGDGLPYVQSVHFSLTDGAEEIDLGTVVLPLVEGLVERVAELMRAAAETGYEVGLGVGLDPPAVEAAYRRGRADGSRVLRGAVLAVLTADAPDDAVEARR